MVLWLDQATQQQPCCWEKMHVVLGDGVDEVDVDVGIERARLMAVGDSIPISGWANQKDTAGDRVYQQDDMRMAVRPDRAAQGAQRVTNTRGQRRQRGSTRWRWTDLPDNNDTSNLAATMAAQG